MLSTKLALALVVLLPVLIGLFVAHHEATQGDVPEMKDEWWGKGPHPKPDDKAILPFQVQVPESVIKDLGRRLNSTRYFTELEDVQFQFGFRMSYMRKVVQYWSTEYLPKWAMYEARLNKYPHFKTQIGGIMVHFLHIKPKLKPGQTSKPLLLLHGWPGSVYEFYNMISILTDSTQGDVFEIVAPSIPGYGWSEASHRKGLDQIAASRLFVRLMDRLGIDQFYVQGGDWGSLIARVISEMQPQKILGLHVNLFNVSPLRTPKAFFKQIIASYAPSLIMDEKDLWKVSNGYFGTLLYVISETGYMHIQATKPDTAGFGLTDSPVGLAAYILEKFSTWSNKENRNAADGNLEKHFKIDDLLTNVMIYWTTNTITSSMRFYKELFQGDCFSLTQRMLSTVPTALACFPHEIAPCPPKVLAKDMYINIVQYTDLPKGGHFGAFEQPEILAQDIRNFVKKIQDRQNSK
ncbi:unnamed protein product [Owenia fusiformis]|uniref:Epoxide hydrolase n=1 Tax=Owenia fusiformis TaxID=6347 RepID=A0A8S4N488_OWEFU|nr:unnamed protein product [Owenia fusiformis]